MAIELEKLSDVDADLVEDIQEELATRLTEDNPGYDLKRGPFHDLLLHGAAAISGLNYENLQRLKRSNSVKAIEDDPTLADDDVTDQTLSNFRVARKEGSTATGSVTIVVSVLASVTIGQGDVFEAGEKTFVTETAFTARTEAANVTAATDRLLVQISDSNYAFTIDVVAEEDGEASRLSKDTLLLPRQQPLHFVRAFAASDFTGGATEETNAELIQRLQEGIAARTHSGRVTMNAFLKDEDNYPNVLATSIIGFGDAEQLRDQRAIWPGSFGGKVDWYIRSSERPQRLSLSKTATLIEKTADEQGVWQFSITRDEAPGLYRVSRVVPFGADATTAGSFEITDDIRTTDLTDVEGLDILPDIETEEEAAYSRFQAVAIRFVDDQTPVAALTVNSSTAVYSVTVEVMPNIADIQLAAGNRQSRNPAGNLLVKAAVPCFVSLAFDVLIPKGQETPDTDSMADAIAQSVNRLGFVGRLPASIVTDVAHNFLESPASLSRITMLGRIRRPDGSYYQFQSNEALLIPDEPENMVTSRTTCFILDPEDIGITVKVVDMPPI